LTERSAWKYTYSVPGVVCRRSTSGLFSMKSSVTLIGTDHARVANPSTNIRQRQMVLCFIRSPFAFRFTQHASMHEQDAGSRHDVVIITDMPALPPKLSTGLLSDTIQSGTLQRRLSETPNLPVEIKPILSQRCKGRGKAGATCS